MITASLARIQYTNAIRPDDMVFSVALPESQYKAATSVEKRVTLALQLLAALEQGMVEYQDHVNNLRGDVSMAKHDFGYPFKTAHCQENV